MNIGDIEILRKAVILWGEKAQIGMLVEECAELIGAINKHSRRRIDDRELMEELVDTQIMIEQMKIIMDDQSLWERTYSYKMSRLKDRVMDDIETRRHWNRLTEEQERKLGVKNVGKK